MDVGIGLGEYSIEIGSTHSISRGMTSITYLSQGSSKESPQSNPCPKLKCCWKSQLALTISFSLLSIKRLECELIP